MTCEVLMPADLLGRILVLNVACMKCERRGRYRVKTLVREIGLDGNIANWLSRARGRLPEEEATQPLIVALPQSNSLAGAAIDTQGSAPGAPTGGSRREDPPA
jgi:hypothetical protein